MLLLLNFQAIVRFSDIYCQSNIEETPGSVSFRGFAGCCCSLLHHLWATNRGIPISKGMSRPSFCNYPESQRACVIPRNMLFGPIMQNGPDTLAKQNILCKAVRQTLLCLGIQYTGTVCIVNLRYAKQSRPKRILKFAMQNSPTNFILAVVAKGQFCRINQSRSVVLKFPLFF